MPFAIPTLTLRYLTPTEDLTIEHRHRCMMQNRCLIVEMPAHTLITYRKNNPFLLRVVTLPDGEVRYVDVHGWMFDDNAITKLLMKRRLRISVESDLSHT